MDNVDEKPTLTDGLAGAVETGSITIELLKSACDEVIMVTEKEVALAIAFIFHHYNEIVEGSGAVGVAAILTHKIQTEDPGIGILVTGGNIDPDKHQKICNQFPTESIQYLLE